MFSYAPQNDTADWRISVLVDTPGSWIEPWAERLVALLAPHHDVRLCRRQEDLVQGDFCFLLGCLNLLPQKALQMNGHNLVVHESDLPNGRGWSPVAWQVLQGKNEIPVCLFEAVDEVDAGPVYLRDFISLNGCELLPDIRLKQGVKTVELCLDFLQKWPLEPVPQVGEPSSYPKRSREDDRLDPHKSIAEQFDKLRIVDNEKYPAWFELRGREYILKIFRRDERTNSKKDK